MRKVVSLALAVLFLGYASVFAGGSGNCIEPLKNTTDRYAIGAAFGYNYVGARLLDLYNYGNDEKNIHIDAISQVYGQVPIGLNENMNLTVRVGSSTYDLKFRDKDSDEEVSVDVRSGVYAGVALGAQYPWGEVSVGKMGMFDIGYGFNTQINAAYNDVKSITRDNSSLTNEDGTLYTFDGENSVFITCKYDIEKLKTSLVPYIGVYQSWITTGTIGSLTYTRNKAEVSHDIVGAFDALAFGLLLGMDIDITKYATINIEGRFIGETAVTTGATVKF